MEIIPVGHVAFAFVVFVLPVCNAAVPTVVVAPEQPVHDPETTRRVVEASVEMIVPAAGEVDATPTDRPPEMLTLPPKTPLNWVKFVEVPTWRVPAIVVVAENVEEAFAMTPPNAYVLTVEKNDGAILPLTCVTTVHTPHTTDGDEVA